MKIKLNYVVQGGITVDNEMVAPQVELGEQATSFIKHEEKNTTYQFNKKCYKMTILIC